MKRAHMHSKFPQLLQVIEAMSPLKRAATSEEVASVRILLCSSSASYINSVALIVDAGLALSTLATGS